MGAFEHKVCVVTGAASGIGRAAAELFAREGGQVVSADLADAEGDFVRTDVSDAEDVERLFAHTVARYGRVDVLVNNAGIMADAELDQATPEDFRRHVDVNTIGVFLGIKYGTRVMPEGSAIVNTASMAGRVGLRGYGPYAAAKAAVVSLTQVAAVEYGGRGIRVNCICPSSVETPMLQAQENGALEREISRLAAPSGMVIAAEQVAEVIAFLAAPASSAVTGQALNVDAGMSAGYSDHLLSAISAAIA
ncbi:SDR family NAD(P)-dependent oxidoreductase [Amycolatopsis jejuensis]|uniref:SDR family NAD(P)-dependent oxidoreductase n=1 Tax=Amycolatopsis jejuensis TaxID=330084 RepID=UPI000526E9B6|nr:SDR family oxidoreductase [Amycolatopsis jejuensis]